MESQSLQNHLSKRVAQINMLWMTERMNGISLGPLVGFANCKSGPKRNNL